MRDQAPNSPDSWAGAHVDWPAEVRTPRASNSSGNNVGYQVQVAKGAAYVSLANPDGVTIWPS